MIKRIIAHVKLNYIYPTILPHTGVRKSFKLIAPKVTFILQLYNLDLNPYRVIPKVIFDRNITVLKRVSPS